jgi:energy-coupling factor transporter ATP-binding protein EcfA2
MVNIKLYDIHGASTIEHYRTLITPDDKYFYWDSKRFTRNEIGDIVFWVNRTERVVLYTKIDSKEVQPSFKDGKNLINDQGYNVSATAQDATQFETFYRFKIIAKTLMPEGWNYSNLVPFNGQTMAIILYEPNINEPENKIEKINDLIPIFINNEEVTALLNESLLLINSNEKKTKKSKMEEFRDYMYTIHKNRSTSDDYMKMMPKIQGWLINNGVVGHEFKIWNDVKFINSINEKLSTTFKIKWKELNKDESNWYSSPWNLWTKFNKMNIPSNDDNAYKEILCAIKTKPFILLAGISGTGKSRLVRTLAYKTCANEKLRTNPKKPGNFELIPVRPNWHDSSELMGYVSRINGEKYITTSFLQFIAKAWKNLDVPFFLCLDEMNLAPVEQYFAEYLSIIETRQVQGEKIGTDYIISKASFENYSLYSQLLVDLGLDENEFLDGISIPNNLVVIGTVNMDETTHSFSRKVLDRAMTFEMNNVDLTAGLDNTKNDWSYPETFIPSIDVMGDFTSGAEVMKEFTDSKKVVDFLINLNTELEGTPFKIAYRVRDEFLIYCYYAGLNKTNSNWLTNALDEMTSMKILSRIEGDETKTGSVLSNLQRVLNADYYKSNAKIKEMEARLSNSGYTSFWS